MADGNTSIALFGLIGALAGTIPGLLGVMFGWLKSRDTITKAMKKVELSKAEVDFTCSWVDTISKVTEGAELEQRKALAKSRLDELMKITHQDINEIEQTEQTTSNKPKQKGSLPFYIFSGFTFFILLGASVDERDNFSIDYFIHQLTAANSEYGDTIYFFAFVWLVWFIYRLFTNEKS